MLESPQDESVVRWGNEGDSFVVLEVRAAGCVREESHVPDSMTERKVYQTHPSEALQTQQLCQFRATT